MFKFRYLAATAILGVALWGAGAARAVIPEQTPQQQFSALRDQYVGQRGLVDFGNGWFR